MDINLFRKSLASKQKLLKEDAKEDALWRKYLSNLSNVNKFLDRTEEALESAVDEIGYCLDESEDLLTGKEKRELIDAAKELNALLAQLRKSANKIPVGDK